MEHGELRKSTVSTASSSSKEDPSMADSFTQSLDGETYTLRTNIPVSWAKKVTKITVGCVTLPILLPFGVLYGMMMATPLYKTIMGLFLPIGMKAVDRKFHPERKELLKNLSGRVLDVGSGGGAYLKYCAEKATAVVAVEPIEHLHPKIEHAAAQAKLQDKLTIFKDVSELDPIEYQFDWIILGNVLCEVDNVQETLIQLDRLLTPGGKVYFSEHVAHTGGTLRRRLQDWVNPMWKLYLGGCNCNRDSIEWMRQTTKWVIIDWVFPELASTLMGPFVLGLASKPLDDDKKRQ
eukprot:scaffold1803_cov92-Amphora_coffeaeformis.AAC.22